MCISFCCIDFGGIQFSPVYMLRLQSRYTLGIVCIHKVVSRYFQSVRQYYHTYLYN